MKQLFFLLTLKEINSIMENTGYLTLTSTQKVSAATEKKLSDYFSAQPNFIKDPKRSFASYARKLVDGIYIPSLNKFISRNDQKGEGANAEYFQLSKSKGIKVHLSVRDTFKEFKNSSYYNRVFEEFDAQKKLSEIYPFVVKAYNLLPVYNTSLGGWTIGIVMQHIDPDLIITDHNSKSLKLKLGRVKVDFRTEKDLSKIINKELKKSMVFHNDIHFGNVLVKNNQIKVIDFDHIETI